LADELVTTHTIHIQDGPVYPQNGGTYRVASVELEFGEFGPRWRYREVRVLGRDGRTSAPRQAFPPLDAAMEAQERLLVALRAAASDVPMLRAADRLIRDLLDGAEVDGL
jgi:hypothetical protein